MSSDKFVRNVPGSTMAAALRGVRCGSLNIAPRIGTELSGTDGLSARFLFPPDIPEIIGIGLHPVAAVGLEPHRFEVRLLRELDLAGAQIEQRQSRPGEGRIPQRERAAELELRFLHLAIIGQCRRQGVMSSVVFGIDGDRFSKTGDRLGILFAQIARPAATPNLLEGDACHRYKFTHTLFVCVYFSSASFPWSRPKP